MLESAPEDATDRAPLSPPGPLSDWVAEVIVGRIDDGYYEPGQWLRETELASDLSVSRAPIRDALRMLERDGLVAISPRRGAFVAEFTSKMVDDLYECRGWLVQLAVKLAVPNLNADDIQYLRSLFQQMEESIAQGNVRDYPQPNRAFHNYLYERSGNSVLRDLHDILGRRVARQRQVSLSLPARAKTSLENHRQLLRAIEEGNVERAAAIAALGINEGRAALRAYLEATAANEGDGGETDRRERWGDEGGS